MSCLTQGQWHDYMEDRLSPADKRRVDSHLNQCTHCQHQLEHWMEDLEKDSSWEGALSHDFSQKIIRTLSAHPVKVLNRTSRTLQAPAWKKGVTAVMKKTAIAAVAFIMAVSGGMLVSPSFASYVQGAFRSTPIGTGEPETDGTQSMWQKIGDPGIRQAAQNGFAQRPHASTTDQGITFEVNEIVADPLRISMIASVRDQNGEPMEIAWQQLFSPADTEPIITITDKQGNILKSGRSSDTPAGNPNKDWQSVTYTKEGIFVLNHELRSYFDDRGDIPDELMVEFRIQKIDHAIGNWKLSVPVDMKKAKAVTSTYAINKTYTTAQGLTLAIRQITFAPSGAELVIDRTNQPNARMDYSYQLGDERGNVIGAWDSADVMKRASKQTTVIEQVKWRHSQPIEKGFRDFHYFPSIDVNQNLTFHLSSVYTEEPADFRVELDLARLEKEPVSGEEQGDIVTFQKFARGEDEVVDFEGDYVHSDGAAKKAEGYDIAFDVTLGKDTAAMYPFDAWSITDETGKTYRADYFIDETRYENGQAHVKGWLRVLDAKTKPEQFIITYKNKMVEHRDVTWDVPIPSKK